MSIKLIRRSAIWLVVLVLCACANLGSIREFAALSSDSAGYTALTNEYATSPTRLKKYTLEADDAQRKILDEQACQRKAQVEKLLLFHRTVSSYMKALSELSSDEIVSYDKELKDLTDKALTAKYIDEKEAGAVNAIAGLIARAATDFYRQKKLKLVIGEANAPLQDLLAVMKNLVDSYSSSLENEKAAIVLYHRRLMTTARQEKQSVVAEHLWLESQVEAERLDTRIRAAENYHKTISAISAAHADLYANRDRVSDKEVQRQMREYSSKIRDAYKAARGDE